MKTIKSCIYIIGFFICSTSCIQKGEHSEIKQDTISKGNSIDIISIENKVDSSVRNTYTDTNTNELGQKLPIQINKYIPSDYFVLSFVKGDINSDTIDDIVLVLSKNGEDSISTRDTPILRPLLLLTGEENGNFFLAEKNDSIVYFNGFDINLKDPFTEIIIKNGAFSICHYGGFRPRWTRRTSFKFSSSDNNWFLFEDVFGCFDTLSEIVCEDKIYTASDFGKIPFSKFSIYEDSEATRRYVKILPR